MKDSIKHILPWDVLQKLFFALSTEGESRLVGGCVREMLSGNTPKDIDVASQVKPDRMIVLLENAGFRCIPTGITHGTITALFDGYHIEVTTLRSDVKTDGRHAEIEFTDDWAEDAKRRDFTINAMYMDLDGNIYDYFNGQHDLRNKIVRFVGDPAKRIQEDYLRILRYFRFCGYLHGVTIDKPSLDACAAYRDKIDCLSGERIREEFFKILTLQHVRQSLEMMQEASILNVILNHDIAGDILRLNFRHKYPKQSLEDLAKKLKLSNLQKRVLKESVLNIEFYRLDSMHDHKKLLYLYGFDVYTTCLESSKILGFDVIDGLDQLSTPVLPVKGGDLQKMYFEGKEIGDRIRHLESIWMESDFTLNKEELLKLL